MTAQGAEGSCPLGDSEKANYNRAKIFLAQKSQSTPESLALLLGAEGVLTASKPDGSLLPHFFPEIAVTVPQGTPHIPVYTQHPGRL